jgi:opacity protein-like surface antigen
MIRRIAGFSAAMLLAYATPVLAQRFEFSVSGGYTTSEGVSVTDRALLGFVFTDVQVKSGSSFNFTGGVYVSEASLIEFLYARQSSLLTAEGVGADLDVSDLNVDSYHVNFVYHWFDADAAFRPYASFGLGATNYAFGRFLLPALPGVSGTDIDDNTQFSGTLGAGVKFYFARSVGVKVGIRWIPTYIKSDAAGYWCDPFYGCWLVADANYSHQFDVSGGVTIRF